jgi:hypothetical protein
MSLKRQRSWPDDLGPEGEPEQLERLLADLHAEDPGLQRDGAAGVARFLERRFAVEELEPAVEVGAAPLERLLVDLYADAPELQAEGRPGVEKFLGAGAARVGRGRAHRAVASYRRFARAGGLQRVAAVVVCAVSGLLAWHQLKPAGSGDSPEPIVAATGSTTEQVSAVESTESLPERPIANKPLELSESATATAAAPPEPETGRAKRRRVNAIEEITVTARRREENLQETPISITAFSTEDLEDQDVRRIEDIRDAVPNLQFDQSVGQASSARIYIRGLGNGDPIASDDPGVGVDIDGVYLPRAQDALLTISDIERVEVLRGPQGALFGKNTIGGAVNIITQKPTADAFAGEGEARAGNYGLFDSQVAVNVPLLPERFAGRISFATAQRDGFATSERTLAQPRFLAGRAQLMTATTDNYASHSSSVFDVTDALEVTAGLRFTQERKSLEPRHVSLATGSDSFSVSSITAWRRNTAERASDDDGTPPAPDAYGQEFTAIPRSFALARPWFPPLRRNGLSELFTTLELEPIARVLPDIRISDLFRDAREFEAAD